MESFAPCCVFRGASRSGAARWFREGRGVSVHASADYIIIVIIIIIIVIVVVIIVIIIIMTIIIIIIIICYYCYYCYYFMFIGYLTL